MISITCADGVEPFTCCDGDSNDHDFSGIIVNDGINEQRLINPLQLARKASSVLVFDEHGSYLDIPVAEVSGVSTVNELSAVLLACRCSCSDYVTREVFSNVTGTITVTATIPAVTSNVVVFVGSLLAQETADYTISGQQISFTENPESETVQVFIFA